MGEQRKGKRESGRVSRGALRGLPPDMVGSHGENRPRVALWGLELGWGRGGHETEGNLRDKVQDILAEGMGSPGGGAMEGTPGLTRRAADGWDSSVGGPRGCGDEPASGDTSVPSSQAPLSRCILGCSSANR